MDPAKLVPQPDAISVPYGWFQGLLLLTFVLHLLMMNTMLGSSIIALATELGGRDDKPRLNKVISRKLPYTIAFTVNFGVAPLLFLQVLYGHFIYCSSVLMAVYWLSVVALLIVAYYCAYLYDFKFDELAGSRAIFIAITTILLLLIGFFFSNNMTFMQRPEAWTRYFSNPRGTLLNLSDKTLYPRYLHFVTASVAVAGLFQAILAKRRLDRGDVGARWNLEKGMRWFSGATLVQMLIGLWFLMSLPPDKRQLFLGDSGYATALLIIGVCVALAVLVLGHKGLVWPSAAALLAAIVPMTLMRDALRRAYLAPYFSLSDLKVTGHYSPLIAFLIVFVIGVTVIGYMLKLAAAAGKEA